MIPVRFHEAADEEVLAELGYLEMRQRGLGRRFLAEVRHAVGVIEQFPESGEEIRAGVRRRMLRRFRYSLIYALEPECALVVAVAHYSRRPDYWTDRLSAGDAGTS